MSRSRWPVVAAFAGVGVATQVCWLGYTPLTTAAAVHFGVDEQAVGWLANLFPLLFVLLSVPAGRALDHRFRPTLAVGAALVAVGAAVRLVDDAYWAALVGQTLAAVAQPILANAITRVAAAYLDPRDRPLGIAIGAGATYLGMIVAIGIGTAANDVNTAVVIGTAISVVAGIAALVALRVPPPHTVATAPQLREVWRRPGVLTLSGVVFLGMGIFVALATWLEPLLAPAGLRADTTGLLLLVMLVAGVVGSIVVPPFAVRKALEARVIQATGAVTAVACLLFGLAPMATGFAASVPLGFLLLAALPVALALVERDGSPAAGPITALVWTAGNAGGIAASALVGTLLDAPRAAFALLAVLGVGAMLLAGRLQHHQDQVAGAEGHDELAHSGDSPVGEDPLVGGPTGDERPAEPEGLEREERHEQPTEQR
ncbi:putative MFS family arabinose efflux permease [Actinokineospora auranticolor]|uniref:Putative MFS family arabinose efflux permease n=1 Tax=Actinokineospora auranticolor TaxID=155976 RepID=A0A2S6GH57_9PSEU|nr:putative MFS family arabinose efflux permease [Actinokineospora auranticolor]